MVLCKKFSLDLCNEEEGAYNAVSKFGERVRIEVTTASDIDFGLTFNRLVKMILIIFLWFSSIMGLG